MTLFKYFLLTLALSCSIFSNELLYKRGFLYSETDPYYLPSHYTKIREHLWVDKDLLTNISTNGSCVLLGFCVDVDSPYTKPNQIVENLSKKLLHSETAFFDYSDQLSGRFIIIYNDKSNKIKFLTDAIGFRPVYYSSENTMLAGHAKLLAINIHKEQFKNDIRQKRITSLTCKIAITQFSSVFQLDPCYNYELFTGKKKLIFPRGPNTPIKFSESVKEFERLISNALIGLTHNQNKPILFSLTAGKDSQTTLEILLRNNLLRKINQCYSYRYDNPSKRPLRNLKNNDLDITEAQKLCDIFKIPYIICEPYSSRIDQQFQNAFTSNSKYFFKDLTDNMLAGVYQLFSKSNFIHLNSNVTEVWKSHVRKDSIKTKKYYNQYKNQMKNLGYDVTEMSGYSYPAFNLMRRQMSRWMMDTWSATDIVFDTFCPYACRKVIKLMLRTPLDFKDAVEVQDVFVHSLKNRAFSAAKS